MENGAQFDGNLTEIENLTENETLRENALVLLPAVAGREEDVPGQWLTIAPPPGGSGLADHPAALYLARLAPSSRQTMTCVLGGVAQTLSAGRHTLWSLPWHLVRYPQMSALRSHLAVTYAPATANLYMTAVRGVLGECWQMGLISAEEKARAVNLPPIRGERLPAGRAVVLGELRALLHACAEEKGPAARRDAALVGVLYGSGLRRAEAAALDLCDLDLTAGSLAVRHGKGNKARQVYLASGGAELLESWLCVRGDSAGPLFVPVLKSGKLKSGKLTMGRLAPQSVRYVLQKRARAAGIKDFSPHDLRRTFVGDLLEAGADISTVQKMAGHASVVTTARYDRRGEQAKKKASGLLHIPME
jgi:integrase